MPLLILPAILKSKDAHIYVGGVEVWKDLVTHYADKLRPIRRTQRGDTYYAVRTIDHVVALAEMEGKLLFDPAKAGSLPEKSHKRIVSNLKND